MTLHNPGVRNPAAYNRFVIVIAGLGGLLYGIDIGIIAAALLYVSKTLVLTLMQTSMIVAAVLGGSMAASPIAGLLADWRGRRVMMIVSGLLFVVSVVLIVSSQGFLSLMSGRLLQGISGGVIAVVIPLYLAECLEAKTRGKGSAIFQFMLTFGIGIASLTGLYYARHAEAAIAAAHGNAALIRAAQDHAWRSMFLSVIYPGLIFIIGACFLSESPRWLFRHGRREKALAALRRASTEEEAQLQMREMEMLAAEDRSRTSHGATGSLLKRKYIVPFLLACVILVCTQTTGINSILGYLVVILKQAGLSTNLATQGDLAVKLLNCVATVVAIVLIDRSGRKFLLAIGTGGVTISLVAVALLFHGFEAQRVDVTSQVTAKRVGRDLTLPLKELHAFTAERSPVTSLTVLYSYGGGDRMTTILSNERDPVLILQPDASTPASAPLEIKQASIGPVPDRRTGWLITACITVFIAAYAVGPGVVVWLALAELMPMRIRSSGMGFALLLRGVVSTVMAGIFLPMVGRYGYCIVFSLWAGCTVLFFITAVGFLPETRGRTLEEIEQYFESGRWNHDAQAAQ